MLKKPFILLAAAASALAASAPAHSALLLFETVGIAPGVPAYRFSFTLDSDTVPNPVTNGSARFNATPITYTRPNGQGPFVENGMFDGPTFFTTINQGGLALLRLDREPDPQFRLFGVQLFTGLPSRPVFALGTFELASTPRNGGDPVQPLTHRLTISNAVVGAVPEPATWVMMLLGFGLTATMLRRRHIAIEQTCRSF